MTLAKVEPQVEVDPTDLDRFIGIREAADRLAIGKSTAYELVAADEFPVPVHEMRGKKVVSLRRLAEHMYGGPLPVAS